jgi:endo-1,4-beta-xylanase
LFNYTGTFNVNGWAYLALYGWTTNPLVEYYVIESSEYHPMIDPKGHILTRIAVGRHNPSDNASANYFGNFDSDGATYEIWQKERTNAPSIIGDNTDFQQYWVRTCIPLPCLMHN